ncbi:MAG: type VI secretion system baseplate subunit TssF [Planctomycetales bacterium]|nr:type VI secretion system baseplate subunit TssF [Planctomycetales bacterium]
MTDDLLPYYHRELAAIRHLGAEFAKAHPKVAGRLRWVGETTEDPHVSRLIEAFAFLTARTRQKLDDDFPELSTALLGVLYPHYLAPIPSAAIIQCRLSAKDAELANGYQIPRGSAVETDYIEGQPCRFRTAYDTTLWPLEVANVTYQSRPFTAPDSPVARQAAAVLKIELKLLSNKIRVRDLTLERLRFYLSGDGQASWDLFESIHNNCLGVVFRAGDAQQFCDDSVSMVGFERNEALVADTARSFPGYRLLSELFSFPEKFSFFDVAGITPEFRAQADSDRLEVVLYLDRHVADLDRWVTSQTIRLGCTPIVNLYRQRAEPIRWDQARFEYRIVPDARRPLAHEIQSILSVIGTSPRDEVVEFRPFYSVQHAAPRDDAAYWYARRARAGYAGGQIDRGTEMYLSLVDLNFQSAELANWTIDVETTCVNRDLPSRLPFGAGQPTLRLTGKASVASVECLTAPSPTYRPNLDEQNLWKLISHLSLGHLSIVDGANGADALREILRVYDPTGTPEVASMIEGVKQISNRRTVGRVRGGAAAGFCRGVEINLQLDEDRFTGSSLFLFSAVLDRFFALYSSINSFTQTIISTTGRVTPLRTWPPRVGEQILL